MALKARGYTLMELIIYAALFALAGGLIASIFQVTSRNQRSTAAAYAVTGQTDTAIRFIRQDLRETALASLRTYTAGGTAVPAVSMISPREMEDARLQGKLLISEYGVPRWRKHVYYAFRKQGTQTLGDLVRWEVVLPAADQDRLPKLAPWPAAPDAKARVILRGVVAPRAAITNLGSGSFTADAWGGFRLQFVQRSGGEGGTENLVDQNPGLNTLKPSDNTRLVEVELAISEGSVGPPNFYRVKFRTSPRY